MGEGALTLGAFFYIFPFIEEGNKPGESFQEWNPRGAAKRAHYIAFNVPGAPKSATPKPFLKHRKAAQSPFGLLALFLALFLAHKIAHKSQGRGGAFGNFYTFPGSISVSYYTFPGVYCRILLHPWAGLFITKRRHQPGRNLTANYYEFLRAITPRKRPKFTAIYGGPGRLLPHFGR